MSVNEINLTVEQKIDILLKKCESREECSNWIKYHMKLHLPDCTVSRYSDTNPLDIVWSIYDICTNRNNPLNIEELLVVAGRGSGKCVEKGTKIRLLEGFKNIEDIVVGDTVFTGWSFAKVAQVFDEGIKPGIKIRSLSGCLAGTPHHRIQAVTPDNKIDWVYLEDIKNGDWVYQSVSNTEDHAIRYPSAIIRPFVQEYPEIKINKDLLKNEYIAKNEVNKIYAYFYREGMQDKMTEIDFILEGHFEKVISIEQGKYYFYDLEIDDERHSYYSNGYISHNTLGMAIAELMVLLHDRRDVVHVGAILSQAKRCYDYQLRFMHNDRMRDALNSDIYGSGPILEKANMEKSVFRLGQNREAVSLEILPCTLKAVNGPHVPLCIGGKTRIALDNSDKSVDINSSRQKVTISAAKLYRLIKEGKKLKALSYNFTTGMVESKPITMAYNNGKQERLKITKSSGRPLWCTLDHKVYSVDDSKYIEAKELKIGSKILTTNNNATLCVDCINLNNSMVSVDIIKDIEFIDTKRTVYDFTIQDNHNFFAGGILVHNCVVDEIDTVSGDGFKAFQDISGMLDSRGDQKALRVGISTRKTRYGLMNQQIEEADIANRVVKRWTVLEFSERCPDSRSGKIPVSAFVNTDEMEVLTRERYEMLPKSIKSNYSIEVFPGEGCLNCAIAPLCRGDSKKQKSKSPMLKPISDPIKKTRENGPEWAISQLFNLKPAVEGIVYREFDKKVHCKTWNQAWEILVGLPYPGECTHDIFVRKCHQMQVPCYAGIDWGWSSPSTVVFFFLDARENIYIVRAAGMKMISNPNWIGTIKENWHRMYRCQLYFPDLAMPGDGVEMRKAGLPVPEKVDKTISSGIQTIKKWLKPLGSPSPKMFLVGEFCEALQNEFELFHFKLDAAGEPTDTPAQKNDHYLDALRYPVYGLLGGNETILSLSDEEYGNDIVQPNGAYTEAPSAAVFAKQNGIAFNTEVDKSSLGKVGTLSELDDKEDIDNNSGFLWSF